MLFDDGVHKLATAIKWIGEIETVQGIVRKPPETEAARDWHMEAPIAAIWKYKDRECLGITGRELRRRNGHPEHVRPIRQLL